MAGRSEARIFTSIWKDRAFLAQPPSAQRMYLFLLSQADLNFCGVISLRERRWARAAEGLTVDQVQADLETLANPKPEGFPDGFPKPFIVIDEDTEELLIRSFVRRDGVWKQPNLMKAAREAAELIESSAIGAALLEDLRRIPIHESSSDLARAHYAEFVQYLEKAYGNPSGKGSGNPSDDPSGNPSQGIGGGNGSSTRDPLTPEPSSPRAPEPPRGAREALPATVRGNDLLDEHLNACVSTPPRDVQRRTGEKIDALLDEGITADGIRAGLALMRSRPRTGPGLLPELVHEAATQRASPQTANGYQPYQNPADQSVYDEDL